MNHARLSEDTDTLRALLLVDMIQDDDFEIVRVVHKPDLSVESILREQETSLMMYDQASRGIGGDGSSGNRTSRRTKHASTSKRGVSTASSVRSSDDTPGGTSNKWSIPRYPDFWKKSFGNSSFKLLLNWYTRCAQREDSRSVEFEV